MATLGATHPAHPHNHISMPTCHALSLSHQEHLCPWYQPPLVPRTELVPTYLTTISIAHPTHPHNHSSVAPRGRTAPYPQPQLPRRVLPRPSSLPAATLSRGTLKVKVSAAKPGWQGAASSHRQPHTCPREASALSLSVPSCPLRPARRPRTWSSSSSTNTGKRCGAVEPHRRPMAQGPGRYRCGRSCRALPPPSAGGSAPPAGVGPAGPLPAPLRLTGAAPSRPPRPTAPSTGTRPTGG